MDLSNHTVTIVKHAVMSHDRFKRSTIQISAQRIIVTINWGIPTFSVAWFPSSIYTMQWASRCAAEVDRLHSSSKEGLVVVILLQRSGTPVLLTKASQS